MRKGQTIVAQKSLLTRDNLNLIAFQDDLVHIADMTIQTTPNSSLVQPLFDGPLDIVGDVHGEIEPLRALMRHLGYGDDGHHPDGRRLIFVGDLTDRGPDSPAVVDLVQELIVAGRAQCVLGNHDLNILLEHRKPENPWFFPDEESHGDEKAGPQVQADEAIRERVRRLFCTLPIALERDDLRVVHACWDDKMITLARKSSDVASLYQEHRDLIEAGFPGLDLDKIDQGLEHQNKNPVKLLSSGPEERAKEAFKAGGKLRREKRVEWWKDYLGAYCVFGHYGLEDGKPRGNSSTYCVDFGVGKRWKERRDGKTSQFSLKLAALRWPEREVVFDEGMSTTADPE